MRLHTKVWNFKVHVAEDNGMGLLGRPPLRQYEALLMIFPYEGFWKIHSLGLNYAIDVLWLNKDNQVVDRVVLPPETPAVGPDLPALKVIEMHAGMSKLAGIKVGDYLTLSSPN